MASMNPVYIPRRLVWTDDQQQRRTFEEAKLACQPTPVVVLAEPGGGKSELFRHAAVQASAPLVTATKWLRTARPEDLLKPGRPIFIDALDEASALRSGDAIQGLLEKLNAAGSPPFVLSCRAADWEGRGSTGIRQDYGFAPLICSLEPFSRAEAESLLAGLCPEQDAAALLVQLDEKGLGTLSGSPLTLQLVAQVVGANGALPNSRADLYEAAAGLLWSEHDPDRSGTVLASLDKVTALDAAGAVCAALLMSGAEVVTTAGPAQAGSGAISVHDVERLPRAAASRATLGSKLFRLAEPGRLVPFHRTLAEYLGARWLARAVGGRTRSRLLARLQPAGSVPARVRGLHAWLPLFDQELGDRAIDCDPYGVVRYGDVDALPLSKARRLLSSLKVLARNDPYFRAGDWAGQPLGALMRPEFADDIDALIGSPDTNGHLRSLLIEGLRNTGLARRLGETLEAIARDRNRFYAERDDALEALECWRDAEWRLVTMEALRQDGRQDATRLAAGMLRRLGPATAGIERTAAVLVADIGLTVCAVPREGNRVHMIRSYHRIVDAVPHEDVASLLDELAAYAAMSFKHVGYQEHNDLADVIGRLALRVLPSLPLDQAARVWAWLKPMGKAHFYTRDALTEVEAILAERSDLRRAVQRHVALELRSRADLGTIVFADLQRTPGFQASEGDLAALLAAISPADRGVEHARADWRELTELLRGPEGLAADVIAIASPFAGEDDELLAHLETVRRPRPPRTPFDWELERAAEGDARQAERSTRFADQRANFAQHRDKLRAGDPSFIGNVAEAYCMQFRDLRAETPLGRLEEWLGPHLAADAVVGLEAVLFRDDLPDLMEVSASVTDGPAWLMGLAALAGVMERLRRGDTLDGVPDHALLLANLHREWCLNVDGERGEAVQKALGDAVADTPERCERWRRLRIEPQLELGRAHVAGLYDVTHEPRFPDVAHRLLREWLLSFRTLPHGVEREMLDALLRAGDHDTVRELSSRRSEDGVVDASVTLFWQVADWITGPEPSLVVPTGGPAIEPEFLKCFSERLGLEGYRPTLPKLAAARLEWLIARFRSFWPLVSRFDDGFDRWSADAADLIRECISGLAADTGNAAAAALERLGDAQTDSYTDALLHAAAEQRQLRSEASFRTVLPAQLKALLEDGPPSTIEELRAIVLDELARAQAMLRGSDTDRVVEFWADDGRPRDENRCRDRIADILEPALQRYGIQRIPEREMPQRKRADLAFACGTMQLPMEVKGQWHAHVWDAASDQLDLLYLRDWRSEDSGIYLVLWFGDVRSRTGRRLKPPPSGEPPTNPQEMVTMLRERVPAARRNALAIRVLDLTR